MPNPTPNIATPGDLESWRKNELQRLVSALSARINQGTEPTATVNSILTVMKELQEPTKGELLAWMSAAETKIGELERVVRTVEKKIEMAKLSK